MHAMVQHGGDGVEDATSCRPAPSSASAVPADPHVTPIDHIYKRHSMPSPFGTLGNTIMHSSPGPAEHLVPLQLQLVHQVHAPRLHDLPILHGVSEARERSGEG